LQNSKTGNRKPETGNRKPETENKKIKKIKSWCGYKKQMQSYTCTQLFDRDAMCYILNNFDSLWESKSIGTFYDKKRNPIDRSGVEQIITTMYSNNLESPEVLYRWSGGLAGRLFSEVPSFQGIARVLRHTIARKHHRDVDIKNAHPVFLYTECKRRNIPCRELRKYIKHRESLLSQMSEIFGATREQMKAYFLAMMNGGSVKPAWTNEYVEAWSAEMSQIRDAMCEAYPELLVRATKTKKLKRRKNKDGEIVSDTTVFNLKGTAMNYWLCITENQVLKVMVESLERQGFQVSALCFDGCMHVINGRDADLVAMAEEVRTQLGYTVEILYKPMEEGLQIPEGPHELVVSENYHWIEFAEGLVVFEDEGCLKAYLTMNVPRVLSRIELGNGYWLKKNGRFNEFDPSKLDSINSVRFMEGEDENRRMRRIPLGQYLLDNRMVRRYTREVFEPSGVCQPNELNIYTKLKADVEYTQRPEDVEILRKINYFLYQVIANGVPESYEYLMKWLKTAIITPHLRTKIFIVLYSFKHQVGKGSFVNFLVDRVFGEKLAGTVTGLDPITQKHNVVLKGKLFMYVDELPSQVGQFHASFDRLKHIITDPTISVEPKGFEAYSIKNYCEFMGSTNNINSVKIEENDRRYVVLNVNETKIDDEPYWTDLHETALTDRGAVVFFQHLRTYETTRSLRDIPQTEVRDDMVELSLPSIVSYINEMRQRQRATAIQVINVRTGETPILNLPHEDYPEGSIICVSKTAFMADYKLYCTENGYTPCMSKMIKQHLPENRNAIARWHEL